MKSRDPGQVTPDALIATLEAATRHHQAGELQQAEAAYRQVLALQPDQPEALHFLGILCYQTGRLEEAAAHMAKATQLRPEQAAFHSNLGAVYQALGKREAAIGCYSQAVALQPDHLQALFNLGLCHFQLGQYDQAEEYYRRALALQPQDPQILADLAYIAWQKGRLATAIEHSEIDIGLDPFPYNGTTTTCETLWGGAPVVVLAGNAHVCRVGVSILTNVGLPELVAQTPEEYVEIAVNLATDLERLRHLRHNLRDMMEQSPLRDPQSHARALERAYWQMWKNLVVSGQ